MSDQLDDLEDKIERLQNALKEAQDEYKHLCLLRKLEQTKQRGQELRSLKEDEVQTLMRCFPEAPWTPTYLGWGRGSGKEYETSGLTKIHHGWLVIGYEVTVYFNEKGEWFWGYKKW